MTRDRVTTTPDQAARWARANEPENDGDHGMNPLRMTRCLWQVLRLTVAPDSTARRWAR